MQVETTSDRTPGNVCKVIQETGIELLPVSHLIEKGHALRLSITSSDIDHFEPLENPPGQFNITCSEEVPSRVVVPLIEIDNPSNQP